MTNRSEVRSVMEAAKEEWEQHWKTVALVARVLQVTKVELSERMGMSPQTMSSRLRGDTTMPPWELAGFAVALGVPESVVRMPPDQALSWLSRQEGRLLRNTCYSVTMQGAA